MTNTLPAAAGSVADIRALCTECDAPLHLTINGTARLWVLMGSHVRRGTRGWVHAACGGRLTLIDGLPEQAPDRIVLEDEAGARSADPLALNTTWRDRLSADVVRNPGIADLLGQCAGCGDSFDVHIGGSPTTWVIMTSEVGRRADGTWTHAGCGGRLRLLGKLPATRPRRIVLGSERRGTSGT